MKKIIILFVLFTCLFFSIFQVDAYKISTNDKKIINYVILKINSTIKKGGERYRSIFIKKIDKLVLDSNKSDRIKTILSEIKNRLKIVVKKENIKEVKNKQNNILNTNNSFYLKNIDVTKVKNTWLWLYNNVRANLNLKPYYYKTELQSTALDWSETSKNRWDMSHKRNIWDSYYDYNKITSWFKDRWVVCKNINRTTNTENIWWGYYSCNDWECTDELIESTKDVFNMFLSEKGKSYNAHYRSIVQPYFRQIGLWIKLDEYKKWQFKYYLTVHFCTEVLK